MKKPTTESTGGSGAIMPMLVRAIILIFFGLMLGQAIISAPFWDELNVMLEQQ